MLRSWHTTEKVDSFQTLVMLTLTSSPRTLLARKYGRHWYIYECKSLVWRTYSWLHMSTRRATRALRSSASRLTDVRVGWADNVVLLYAEGWEERKLS